MIDRSPERRTTMGRKPRRGSVYMLVLIVSIIVFVLGVGAIQVEGIRARQTGLSSDAADAAVLAQSAVEHGLHFVQESIVADESWRDLVVDADETVSPVFTMGGGTFQWSLEDGNGGQMSSDPSKPVHIVGTGWVNGGRSTLRAVVRPSGPALNCLAVGLFADDGMAFASGTIIQSDSLIASNGDIEAANSSVFPDVESAGQIIGATYHGLATPFATPRGVPDHHDVKDYYEAAATVIPAQALPIVNGDRLLSGVVLSPDSNPFGEPNPEGIYLIDCDEGSLVIRDCRVIGTLLIEGQGPGDDVTVTGSVHIGPATANFPCLLSTKDLILAMSPDALSESIVGANFNPAGTPYEGESDELNDDTYPSIINGLIYSEDDVRLDAGYNRVNGTIVANRNVTSGSGALLELTYRPQQVEDPPPGFFVPDGNVRIAAFSWAQVQLDE